MKVPSVAILSNSIVLLCPFSIDVGSSVQLGLKVACLISSTVNSSDIVSAFQSVSPSTLAVTMLVPSRVARIVLPSASIVMAPSLPVSTE